MSDKQNIFQKIKGWFKSSRKRRSKQNTVSSLFLNAVIKKPDLMPIYKKSSTPPLKSILKNNRQKDKDLLNINLMDTDIMNTQFNDKDVYGDSKIGKVAKKNSFVGDMKIWSEKNNKRKLNKNKNNVDSVDDSDEKQLKTNSNSLTMNSNRELDEKEMSTVSLASVDHYKEKHASNASFRKRNKKILRLNKKEDTISRMNVFQKDSSFINSRKAAIQRFQNFKRDNRKISRCSSEYSNIVITPDMEMFDVLMDNTLERYPSQCPLDISSILDNESFILRRRPSSSKDSDSLINVPFNSAEFSSSERFDIESSVPSCSGNIPVVENRPLNRKKKQ